MSFQEPGECSPVHTFRAVGLIGCGIAIGASQLFLNFASRCQSPVGMSLPLSSIQIAVITSVSKAPVTKNQFAHPLFQPGAYKVRSLGLAAQSLRLILRRRHWQDQQMARIVGVSKTTVSRWLGGKQEPRSLQELVDIAQSLGVTTGELLGLSDHDMT